MTAETADVILDRVLAESSTGDQLHIMFQGGEPTLAGISFFRRFVSNARKKSSGVRLSWSIQTNGSLLNDEWCVFLAKNGFLVGLSYDLSDRINDAARIDANGRGTSGMVQRAVALLRKHHVEFNILCTLTEQLAHEPQKVWQAITGNDLRYIQFTPCLFTGEKQTDPWGLHPTSFASFYQRLFVLWLDTFRNGQYYSIKFFDDMIRRIAFGEVNVCGLDGVCRPQLVIEADGSVYPCDFDCLDDSFLGNIRTTSVGQLFLASADAARRRDTGTGDLCRDCRYYVMCGGGCCRMRENICYAANDRICGMKLFLDDSISNLTDIAVRQAQIGRYSDLR